MATSRKVQRQPAYILARHPFSESSLVLDAFCRDHGRVPLMAKGARRLKSPHRGIVQAFFPLALDWSGRRELVTLVRAELVGAVPRLAGAPLMCAWYANELLLKFLHRGDPHEALFSAYESLLAELAEDDPEWALRRFEAALLADVGYGLVLEREVIGQQPIEARRGYLYIIGRGPVEDGAAGFVGTPVRGETLLALHSGARPGTAARREAKILIRTLLAGLMEGRHLKSRSVFMQMYGPQAAVDDG